MLRRQRYLAAVLAGIVVSIANGAPELRINGLDATVPLKIQGKDELVISVSGAGDVNEQSYSVICEDRGLIEPVSGLNEVEDRTATAYRFVFAEGWELGTVGLVADGDMIIDGTAVSAGTKIYKLHLCYSLQAKTTTAIGIDFEGLSWVAPATETKSEPQAEQQIFASQDDESERDYFAGAFGGGTSGIDSFPEPNFYPNLNGDDIVNFADFAVFAGNWQKSGAGLGGDFDDNGAVDINDMQIFAYFWLNGPHPVNVFGLFKGGLAAGDVNEALTYITEISRGKYKEIFQIIEPYLSDYAAGMGELTFDRHSNGEVKYEMLHQDGAETYSFPIFFIRDEDGNWKIYGL